jgi:DNA-directed RNA polymerase specialized sigma subunit
MEPTRQEKDFELWQRWKKSNSSADLTALLVRLQPLIQREVGKWGSAVPTVALEAKGRELTVEALRTYNPSMGAAIGTHVTSRLRKLSRYVYPYQNIARLPENKTLMFNTFTVASSRLYDDLGREPTTEELADELKWTPKRVAEFNRSFGRKELVESEGSSLETSEVMSPMVGFYYHGLAPDDKLLFEAITGYPDPNGRNRLSNSRIMSKFKMTQGQLSYKKRKFIEQIKVIQGGKTR